jgi:hypothetical protein
MFLFVLHKRINNEKTYYERSKKRYLQRYSGIISRKGPHCRHGKPASVVIGFHDEEDWFGYKRDHDEKSLNRIAKIREKIWQGRYMKLDELPD